MAELPLPRLLTAALAWIRRNTIEEEGRDQWNTWRTWLDTPPDAVDLNAPTLEEAAMLAAWQAGQHGVIEG